MGMALEKATTEFGGMDRAKQFPSLGAAARVKEGEEGGFNPADVQGAAAGTRGSAAGPGQGWGGGGGADFSAAAYPSLGGGGGTRSPRSAGTTTGGAAGEWGKKARGGNLQAGEFPTLGGGGAVVVPGGAGAAGVWSSSGGGGGPPPASLSRLTPVAGGSTPRGGGKKSSTGGGVGGTTPPPVDDFFLVDEDRAGGAGGANLTMAERLKIIDQQHQVMAQAKTVKEKKKKAFDLGNQDEAFPGLQPLGGTSHKAKGSGQRITRELVFGNSTSSAATEPTTSSAVEQQQPSSIGTNSSRTGQQPQRYNAKQDLQTRATLNSNPNAPGGAWGAGGSASSGGSSALHALRQEKAQKQQAEVAKRELLKNGYGKTTEASVAGASVKKSLRQDGDNFPALMASKKSGVLVPQSALGGGLRVEKMKVSPRGAGSAAADAWDAEDASPQREQPSGSSSQAFGTSNKPSFLDKLKEAKRDSGTGDLQQASAGAGSSSQWGSAADKAKARELKKVEHGALDNEELFPTLPGGAGGGAPGVVGSTKRQAAAAKAASAKQRQEEEDARLAAQLQREDSAGAGKKKGRQKKTLIAWG